jgi:hypothetical protein
MSDTPEAEALALFLKTHGKQAATYNDLSGLFDTLMEKWAEMNERNVERNARLDALEKDVAALKARPLQKWAGVHIEGVPYAEASLVTRQGSLWAATCATTTTPGVEGSDWRLIVKRGTV